MAQEIKWTRRAQLNFDSTVEYIKNEWGINSAKKFVRKVHDLLQILKNQPKMGKVEFEEKGIRSFVFSRQNTLFYRLKGKHIILLAIFDNRQKSQDRLK